MWPRSESSKTAGGGSRMGGNPGRTGRCSRRRPRCWFLGAIGLSARPPLLSCSVRRRPLAGRVFRNGRVEECYASQQVEGAMLRNTRAQLAAFLAVAALLGYPAPTPAAPPADKPPRNVIFVICDQETYHLTARDD